VTSPLYRLLVRTGISLAPLAARRNPRIGQGLAERRSALDRYAAWASAHRDARRPLLWVHAASVGETRQAEAVLRVLRPNHPDWQIVGSWFSPSASGLGPEGPDFAACLPWDRRGDVERVLDLLRPAALVFCKLDLWPELATRAARRGIPVGMIAATVSPRARRLRWPARALLAPGYRALTRVGAIGREDAERLVRLGVAADRVAITGDPRFDSAFDRAGAIRPDDPLRRWARRGATLVAGSTWPEDEDRLLAAFRSVRRIRPDAGLILVPHEPDPEHLDRIDRTAGRLGIPNPLRLGSGPPPETRFLVVDRVGVLPIFYADAAIAYVGGGFGTTGLHSVLEPAAAGVPTLMGPAWQGSPDAGALLEARGAAVVDGSQDPDWLDLDPDSTLADAGPLPALWMALLRHPEHARAAGARARAFVERGLGAAERSAAIVEEMMTDGRRADRPKGNHPSR
jgi:3-deoxy-D-manno-octulosonic-acid transferase